MEGKTITIAIATFNSAKILERVLKSIRGQDYEQSLITILLVDGGSVDDTKQIGANFGCIIMDNPQTEPVHAKYLAFTVAQTDYLMYLDHDEVLHARDNLKRKIGLFQEDANIKAVATGGYINPSGYPFINEYINEFGDPFSCFMYRLSKHQKYFLKEMRSRYKDNSALSYGYSFEFKNLQKLPLIELCAGGGVLDVQWFRHECNTTITGKEQIPHFFYYMVADAKRIGITNDDYIIHYSADILKKYFKKIEWRVKNNIFHQSTMGESGYSGREKLQFVNPLKKVLFLPYALLILPCMVDSICLSFSRRDSRYMIHILLSWWTAAIIVFYSLAHFFGYHPHLQSYDGSTKAG